MNRQQTARATLAGALAFTAALAALGCGGEGDSVDGSADEAAAADTVSTAAEGVEDASADSAAVPLPGANPSDDPFDDLRADPSDDPFAGFQLETGPEVTAEPRRIALLLLNHASRPAVVYADGGAGEVLLDSVAAGGEARVDVLTRAPMIALRSVTGDGEVLLETEVAPGPDTVVEVLVGRGPPAQ